MDRTLSAVLRRRQQALLLGAAGAVVVVASVLPLVAVVAELPGAAPSSLAVLGAARPWLLLVRSLGLSAASTAGAMAIGIPLGLLIARTDIPARRVLWALHAFPMFLPPFVLALGWFHLFGRDGVLGTQGTAALLFAEPGMVCVLAITFSPVVTSLTALGVLGVDASLEEAARVVSGPRRVLWRILLPAARPALALAGLLVFALSLSELGVPMFLRVQVFPAAVFARLGGVDYAPGEALALALPLVPIALGLLFAERHLAGARSFAVAGLRGLARRPLQLGRWRPAVAAGCWLAAPLSLAPLAALAGRAVRDGGLAELPRWLGQAPLTSLTAAAVAAAIIAALGLVVGHGAARRVPGAGVLDALAVLAFVVPASVLGVGLIAAWNRPATHALYASVSILVIGYVARYTLIGVRAVSAVVLQSPPAFEEAAATCGAGAIRRLLRIVLPVNARGVISGWLLALVFCLRDLETAVLFYPPGREPLTVRLFTLEANGPPGVVAGLALTQVALTAAVLGLGTLLLRSRRFAG